MGLYRVAAGDLIRDFANEAAALELAEAEIRTLAAARAKEAGAEEANIELVRDVRAATVEGQRTFIEAILIATAAGRPRIAA